jgi:type IV pilus modification protein PilV
VPAKPASKSSRRASPATIPGRGAREGFTLIELLISILIVSIGMLSTIFLQTMSIRHGNQADSMTVASLLAESEIERLKTFTEYNQVPLAVASGVEYLSREGDVCVPATEKCFARTTELTSQTPTKRSHTVKVTVSWSTNAGHDSVVYEAILTDINLGNSGTST